MTHTQLVLLEIVEFLRIVCIVGLGTAMFLGFGLMLGTLNEWALIRQAKANHRAMAEAEAKRMELLAHVWTTRTTPRV